MIPVSIFSSALAALKIQTWNKHEIKIQSFNNSDWGQFITCLDQLMTNLSWMFRHSTQAQGDTYCCITPGQVPTMGPQQAVYLVQPGEVCTVCREAWAHTSKIITSSRSRVKDTCFTYSIHYCSWPSVAPVCNSVTICFECLNNYCICVYTVGSNSLRPLIKKQKSFCFAFFWLYKLSFMTNYMNYITIWVRSLKN